MKGKDMQDFSVSTTDDYQSLWGDAIGAIGKELKREHARPRKRGGEEEKVDQEPVLIRNTTRQTSQYQSSSHKRGGVTKPQRNCSTKWSMLHELS